MHELPVYRRGTSDYVYIRAWGRYMLSNALYIQDQIEQAAEDGAPADAVYRREGGEGGGWVRFEELQPVTSKALAKLVGATKHDCSSMIACR
jgi:hypothetical protein